MILFLITIAPSFFIVFYLINSDRFPEPKEQIIKTFLWGIAIIGTLAHFAWTKAYSMAEITSLEPIGFIKLPIIALLGWLIFSEIPDTWTWAGGLIIFISTIYISHRETIASDSLKPNIGAQEPKL